ALDYLIQITFVEDTTVTQAQVAKEYGTSPGTVSTNYRRLADGMADQIDEHDLLTDDLYSEATPKPTFLAGPDKIGEFSMEKEMRDIQKLLAENEFETPEDA